MTIRLDAPDDDMRTITAAEAQRTLGIPIGSITAWRTTRQLLPAEITADGRRHYRLAHILALHHGTTRRAPHVRPKRGEV